MEGDAARAETREKALRLQRQGKSAVALKLFVEVRVLFLLVSGDQFCDGDSAQK